MAHLPNENNEDIQEFIDYSSTQVYTHLNRFVAELRDKVDGAVHAEREACITTLETLKALAPDPVSVETLANAIYILRLRDKPDEIEKWIAIWNPSTELNPTGFNPMRLREVSTDDE